MTTKYTCPCCDFKPRYKMFAIDHADEWSHVVATSPEQALELYFAQLAYSEGVDELPENEAVRVQLPNGKMVAYRVTGELDVAWTIDRATPQENTP